MSEAYGALVESARESALLRATAGLLSWDQRTQLPPGGVEQRSAQLAQLARLIHERETAPQRGEWIAECEGDPVLTNPAHADSAANLRELRRAYDRATRLPAALVEERTRTRTIAEHEWERARASSDFSRLAPWLEKNLEIARRQAECFGWETGDEPWDALAEGYETGMRARDLIPLFAQLHEQLGALAGESGSADGCSADAVQRAPIPVDAQLEFIREVTATLGFDYARGRIDTTAHPFCWGAGPRDVRITTRLDEWHFLDALLAAIHEAGHGMYEQGLPPENWGTPLGSAVSLGIHESQSRLWENGVGRSAAFWRWCLPRLQSRFPDAFGGRTPEDIGAALCRVTPSWIRVEADACTYDLHIAIRFELERALLSGDLPVAGLPAEWNRRYRDALGVTVPDDARGCLQDVHWAAGLFGYFPTYTLGNLYAAQLFEAAQRELPGLQASIEEGEFEALREWLRSRVHAQGSRLVPKALCEAATGEPLSSSPLLRLLRARVGPGR